MNERTMVYLDDVVDVIYQALRTPLPDYHKDPFHDSMGVAMAMANEIPSAQPEYKTIHPDCADCINHGGDWECDHIHCRKGQPEQRKGEWVATYSNCGGDVWVSWKCSKCGYVRKKGWEHTNDGEKPDARFCEICATDMRGEQDE